jgi:hypothetical protein
MGPTGLLLPLHIEDFMALQSAYQYYNFISLFLILLFLLAASQRDERFAAIGGVGMSAFCVYLGWLNYTNAWAATALCGFIAIIYYVTAANREKFGQRGQGSLLLNVVFVIAAMQIAFGVINATAIFPSATQTTITNGGYQNVNLGAETTKMINEGGLLQNAIDEVTVIADAAMSSIRVVAQIVLGMIYFPSVIWTAMPWLQGNAAVVIAMNALCFAMWFIEALWFYNTFWKPGFETARV